MLPVLDLDPVLSKQRRSTVGELHISAAVVPPNPTESDGALDSGAELIGAAASRQKRLVDALDVDAHPSCTASTPLAISISLRAATSGSAKGWRSTNFTPLPDLPCPRRA